MAGKRIWSLAVWAVSIALALIWLACALAAGLLNASAEPVLLPSTLVISFIAAVLSGYFRQKCAHVEENTEHNRRYPFTKIATRISHGESIFEAVRRVGPAQVLAWAEYVAAAVLYCGLRCLAIACIFLDAALVVATIILYRDKFAMVSSALISAGMPYDRALLLIAGVLVFGALSLAAPMLVLVPRKVLTVGKVSREWHSYVDSLEADSNDPKILLRLLTSTVIGRTDRTTLRNIAGTAERVLADQ